MKTKINGLESFFLALLVSLLAISCDNPKKGGEPEHPKDTTEDRTVERPKETITLERAHDMYMAYQERFDAHTKVLGKEDATYGWHSLEFYKNYIAYLEQESRKVGIRISGLRMYYVAYPEDEKSGEYKGYQTFIYVPTYFDKEKGRHIAFDPLNIGEDGKPLPIHEIIVNGMEAKGTNKAGIASATMLMSATSSDGTLSAIANMGEMCEPNCSTY